MVASSILGIEALLYVRHLPRLLVISDQLKDRPLSSVTPDLYVGRMEEIAFAVDDVLAMASSLDQSAEILINLPEATFALLLVYKVLGRLVDALLP